MPPGRGRGAPAPGEAKPEEILPGEDFLKSLQSFFREAIELRSPDYPDRTDFRLMISSIITYLQACEKSKTTAAGRAEAPIRLPDGSEPRTRIALPPKGFVPDDKLTKKLMNMTCGQKIVGALQMAIWKHCGRKIPRKRKATAEESVAAKMARIRDKGDVSECRDSAGEASREDCMMDNSVEAHPPAAVNDSGEEAQADGKESTLPSHAHDSPKEQVIPDSSPEPSPKVKDEVPEETTSDQPADTPTPTLQIQQLPSSPNASPTREDDREINDKDMEDKIQQVSEEFGTGRTSESNIKMAIQICAGEIESAIEWLRIYEDVSAGQLEKPVPDPSVQFAEDQDSDDGKEFGDIGKPRSKAAASRRKQNDSRSLMTGTTASLSHEGSDALDLPHRTQKSSKTATRPKLTIWDLRAGEAEKAKEIAEDVPYPDALPFAALYPKLAKFPTGTWAVYQSQIERLHYSGKLRDMTIIRRTEKIARICVNPEEQLAMSEGRWERVKAAVVIAGFLGERTGAEMATDIEKDSVDAWVWDRMRGVDLFRMAAESRWSA
ncbi:hypothetical protein CC79DRAFT_1373366 [Sarocladium strictum]